MKPRKAELAELAALLEAGAETPEQLAELFVKRLDELRGARSHHYAAAIVAGIPMAVGPYSTRNQAQKALEKFPVDKAWYVHGWTPEGWTTHLAEVDAPPPPHETEQLKGGQFMQRFWSTVNDKEHTAIVARNRGDLEVKVVRPGRGYWG